MSGTEPAVGAGRTLRGWAVLPAVVLAAGVSAGAAAFAVVALPLLFFAQAVEPGQALDRPFVRTGLLAVAMPLAAVVAVAAAVATGLWYRRRGVARREEVGAPHG